MSFYIWKLCRIIKQERNSLYDELIPSFIELKVNNDVLSNMIETVEEFSQLADVAEASKIQDKSK